MRCRYFSLAVAVAVLPVVVPVAVAVAGTHISTRTQRAVCHSAAGQANVNKRAACLARELCEKVCVGCVTVMCVRCACVLGVCACLEKLSVQVMQQQQIFPLCHRHAQAAPV